MNDKGSFTPLIIAMFLSFAIVSLWNTLPSIREGAHAILDPSLGVLLNWNLVIGMMIVVLIISLITSLFQKYATDQETLRELKKEQKELQSEANKFKSDPAKMMEINKKNMARSMEIAGSMMKISMRPIVFTSVPFILLFRWFYDYFGALESARVLGMHWILFYLIFAMIFGSVLRKVLKIA